MTPRPPASGHLGGQPIAYARGAVFCGEERGASVQASGSASETQD